METEKKILPQHQKFIDLVANGTNQAEAYRLSVGNGKSTSGETSKVKGSQLAKRFEQEIADERERQQAIVQGVKDSAIVKEALKGILSQAEVDAKVCKIISGELETEKIFVTQTGIKKVMEKPSQSDILRAADIYYKRFGSYADQQIEIAQGEKIMPTVIKWGNKKISV